MLALVIAGALLGTPAAHACGYHNPQDAALGILNWTFPKALYVRTAVWMAEESGLLPPRDPQKPQDLFAFHRTTANLQTFARRLSIGSEGDGEGVSFAVVLIDSMLWTRFEATPSGYAAQVHVESRQSQDVVVVTDSKVIRALVDGSLDARKAEIHGLLRLYGPPDRHDKARDALIAATRPANALHGAMAVEDDKQ
jgi:hypothetical protein